MCGCPRVTERPAVPADDPWRALKRKTRPLVDGAIRRLCGPPLHRAWGVRTHGDGTLPRVVLTFDDSPVRSGTEQMLDALGGLGVSATFFCVGLNARRHPALVRRIVGEGHALGNHSLGHGRYDGLSPRDTTHIMACQQILTDLAGVRPLVYRSPYGRYTPWEVRRLRTLGLTAVSSNVDGADWQRPARPAEHIARDVLGAVSPGAIVVLHDGYAGLDHHEASETALALRLIVPALEARGYTFVTVPTLLGLPGE